MISYFNCRTYIPFISESFGFDAGKLSFAGKNTGGDLGYSFVEIDKEQSKSLNRPFGRYISFEPDIDFFGEEASKNKVIKALSEAFILLNGGRLKNALIVGLGNSRITADSLGAATCKPLLQSNDFKVLLPDVGAVTGIDSFDIVQSVCRKIKPSAVVVCDTLSSEKIERLGRCFQLTDSGIAAGSGIGNLSLRLSKETLGVNVIVVGVPLVIYAKKICASSPVSDMVLTPSNIDYLVNGLGDIIGNAIKIAV